MVVVGGYVGAGVVVVVGYVGAGVVVVVVGGYVGAGVGAYSGAGRYSTGVFTGYLTEAE